MLDEREDAPLGDLARAAVRGVVTVAAARAVVSVVTFAAGLYLMGRVRPTAFGLVEYAVALLAIVDSLASCGFSHGAIHRRERVDETFSAYLVLRVGMAAVVLGAVVGASAAWPGLLAGRTRWSVLGVLAAALLLGAACDVWATRLRRAMRFGRLAAVDTASTAGAAGVGVGLAAAGFGLWALVAYRAGHSVLRAGGLWLANVERTRFCFARRDAAWLLRFGLPLWLGGLATTWVLKYDDLVVGSVLGSATLGHYSRAYALALLPLAVVTGVLTQVSTPLYARLQGERRRLSEAFRLVSGTTLRLVAPLAAGMALVVGDFLVVMGWPQWEPLVPLFRGLLLYAVLRPLMDDAGGLLTAVGRPRTAGHTLVAQALALVVLCPALTGWAGAAGAALSVGLVVAGGLGFWYVWCLPRFVDVPWGRLLVWPFLSAAVAAGGALAAAAWVRPTPGLAAGALKLAVVGAAYVAALLALDGRRTASDIRALLRHARGERSGDE